MIFWTNNFKLILAMAERIMITGAAGFIGSNLADSLLGKGLPVMGIDNFDPFYDRKIKETNIAGALLNPDFQFREGDIRDADFINRCFSEYKPGIVVHLAAKAGVRPSLADPRSYYDVNVMGTLNILEMMKLNKITRLIFASSSSVYGNNKKVPFSENDSVDFPISPYAASKKAGELLCCTYNHLYNIDIFCLRFFTVYGPRQRPDLAIHKFTKAMLSGEDITMYGEGTTSRDYTHINDIIGGIGNAIDKVKGFDIFNLGESKTISLSDLVKSLENYTQSHAHIQHLPLQEGDVFRTFADITKARSRLNYNPVIDIETGLRDFVDWFRRDGHKR
jgi:UDP-glucuronate 4-epimerase